MSEEELNDKPIKRPKKETMQSFVNNSKKNIFCEKGRVLPGSSVSLLPSIAKKYSGLKRNQ